MANARPAIERALELDPEMGKAYTARGFSSFFFEGDAPAGAAAFSRAIELNPNLPDGYTTKTIGGNTYYVYDGVYYQARMVDGGTAYAVARV